MVEDLGAVRLVLAGIAEELDHRLLNDIPRLGAPTLENLARFIFGRAKSRLPAVARVCVRRPSCGQSCTFEES
jgi:6-pyruvoyltetrahydropterin/6-carboxytetrahydropterin synthase